MGGFAGKRILVSGGSKGIGRATAVELARQGASVCVAARKQADLDQAVEAMKAVAPSGAVLTSVSMDVSDVDAVNDGVNKAIEVLGGLDVVICNQGFALFGKAQDAPASDYERMFRVNFLGHANVVRAAVPHLIEQKSGSIVLVSSVMGYLSAYASGAYAASKWAIVGYAEALRQELRPHGVKVQVVYPGTTETPGLEAEQEHKPNVLREVEENSAVQVVRKPEQVARTVLKVIQGGRFENPVGWDGWLMFLASRHIPWAVRMFLDSDVKKALRKHGDS